MPKQRPTVVSFWIIRDEEHPEARERNYPGQLQILQRSCERAGLKHIVLTDDKTANDKSWPEGVEPWNRFGIIPTPLMQACTEVQARYLESKPESDTLFVGADCIVVGDVTKFPRVPGMCVTYRERTARYPINTGAVLVRRGALALATPLFRRIANRTGTVWCDDQRAIRAELEPMPPVYGVYNRAGLSVAFLPMHQFNRLPRSAIDPCRDAVLLHFRGKRRKPLMFDWARVNGFSA